MSDELQAGAIVAGKYRVEKQLGRGGMAFVVSAIHLQLGSRVAIKMLQPALLKSPDVMERFLREARAAAQIQNEHVARVLDIGVTEGGAPFIVMEHLRGRDLAARVREGGALSPVQAVDFLLEACEALAECHALGIIHRDVKSANLFCVERADGGEMVKLLDFGVSKLAPDSDLDQTGTGIIFGSPNYMSPEQMVSSRQVDPRADIWSLGVVLYELLTGTLPFRGANFAEIVLVVAGTDPDLAPLAATGCGDIVAKCLRRPASERYQSILELARDLAPLGSAQAQVSLSRIERVTGRGYVGEREPTPPISKRLMAKARVDESSGGPVLAGPAVDEGVAPPSSASPQTLFIPDTAAPVATVFVPDLPIPAGARSGVPAAPAVRSQGKTWLAAVGMLAGAALATRLALGGDRGGSDALGGAASSRSVAAPEEDRPRAREPAPRQPAPTPQVVVAPPPSAPPESGQASAASTQAAAPKVLEAPPLAPARERSRPKTSSSAGALKPSQPATSAAPVARPSEGAAPLPAKRPRNFGGRL